MVVVSKNLQIVSDCDIPNYESLSSSLAGSCVNIEGDLVQSQGKNQSFEIVAKNGVVLGALKRIILYRKKQHLSNFLEIIAHFRARTTFWRRF